MVFCPSRAQEAAALAIRYPKEPVVIQAEAKALMRNIILSGDIGMLPPERLKDLAIWINMPNTTIAEQNRSIIQVRADPGDKIMIKELADAYTDGNMSKLIINALRQTAGVDI
jgi:hypothetical protein